MWKLVTCYNMKKILNVIRFKTNIKQNMKRFGFLVDEHKKLHSMVVDKGTPWIYPLKLTTMKQLWDTLLIDSVVSIAMKYFH